MTLICSAPAHPPAHKRWYKAAKLLTTIPNLTLTNVDLNTLSLQIPEITLSALGTYKCQAENDLGQSEAEFIFTGKIENDSFQYNL